MNKLITLVLIGLVSLSSQATAQDILPPRPFPMATMCSNLDPAKSFLEKFKELPFVDGEAKILGPQGKYFAGSMRMFLNPTGESFSIVFSIGDTWHCVIMTGTNAAASIEESI
jgi:hypothetical protein|tara:strand:+ start:91 stop:429 length:339 start_codon:yes stop_codon:yes gene_type:complete